MDKFEALPLFRVGGKQGEKQTNKKKSKRFIRVHEALFFRKVSDIKPEYCHMPHSSHLNQEKGETVIPKQPYLKQNKKAVV